MSDPQINAQVNGILIEILAEVRELRTQLCRNAKPLLTVEEVGQLTGRTPYTVRRWIKDGVIRADRVQATGPRGRLLVPRTELRKLLGYGQGGRVPSSAIPV